MLHIFLRSQNKSNLLCPFLPESPTCSSHPAYPVADVHLSSFLSTCSLLVICSTSYLPAVTCISMPVLLVCWRVSSFTWSPLTHLLPFPTLTASCHSLLLDMPGTMCFQLPFLPSTPLPSLYVWVLITPHLTVCTLSVYAVSSLLCLPHPQCHSSVIVKAETLSLS